MSSAGAAEKARSCEQSKKGPFDSRQRCVEECHTHGYGLPLTEAAARRVEMQVKHVTGKRFVDVNGPTGHKLAQNDTNVTFRVRIKGGEWFYHGHEASRYTTPASKSERRPRSPSASTNKSSKSSHGKAPIPKSVAVAHAIETPTYNVNLPLTTGLPVAFAAEASAYNPKLPTATAFPVTFAAQTTKKVKRQATSPSEKRARSPDASKKRPRSPGASKKRANTKKHPDPPSMHSPHAPLESAYGFIEEI